jgi:putative membrane protein
VRLLRIAAVAALGLALALFLIVHTGLDAVGSAVAAVGWSGFAMLCLYMTALFPFLGWGWYVLLPKASAPRYWVFVWARMVREAASDVLPFSQLGGIVLGARAAILHGVSLPWAFASTVVDLTAELLAQVAYIAIGLAMLGQQAPHIAGAAMLTRVFALGLAAAAVAGVLFVALQRRGHRMTGRLAARLLPRAVASATAVADSLDAIYASRARVALSATIHLALWLLSAVDTWIAFRLIGVRIELASVIAMESLVSAAKSAAVFIPNALGVQEASYALLAPLFGVGAEFGLAVSLLRRARDIAISVPIVLISQIAEGRRAVAREAQG